MGADTYCFGQQSVKLDNPSYDYNRMAPSLQDLPLVINAFTEDLLNQYIRPLEKSLEAQSTGSTARLRPAREERP